MFYRVLFYGIVIMLPVLFFWHFKVFIEGNLVADLFKTLAVIGMVSQGLNVFVIRKIGAIPDVDALGEWAQRRLKVRLKHFRKIIWFRIVIGLIASVVVGVIAVFIGGQGKEIVGYWPLGVGVGFILISAMMLALALYEFYVMSSLESDLKWKARKAERKAADLDSLCGAAKSS